MNTIYVNEFHISGRDDVEGVKKTRAAAPSAIVVTGIIQRGHDLLSLRCIKWIVRKKIRRGHLHLNNFKSVK